MSRTTAPSDADPTPDVRPPAVELHLHLEGALTAARARQLAATMEDPPEAPEGVWLEHGGRVRWNFEDLPGFLRCFGWGSRLLRTPRAYLSVLDDLIVSLDDQRISHAEIFVAIGQMHRGEIDPGQILPALARRAREHAQAGGVDIWFVADATRNWGRAAVDRVLDTALDLQEHRIVGFGVGGDETTLRAREMRATFRRAAAHGLGLSCHSGEGTHPDAVRETVEELGVRRVGHGIAAVDDERLLRELRQEDVLLEVCPTSNQRTGVWDPRQPHPLRTLLAHDVAVVLGSDDPAFFGCTLRSEIERVRRWGVDEATVEAMRVRAHERRFRTSS